jgi:hypothetical protein
VEASEPESPAQRGRSAEPLATKSEGTHSVAVGGLTLGALGLIPLLGLAFSVLGAVLSLAALRSLHRRGQRASLAVIGLAVSLTTAVPGVLLWGWLQSASAAW